MIVKISVYCRLGQILFTVLRDKDLGVILLCMSVWVWIWHEISRRVIIRREATSSGISVTKSGKGIRNPERNLPFISHGPRNYLDTEEALLGDRHDE